MGVIIQQIPKELNLENHCYNLISVFQSKMYFQN